MIITVIVLSLSFVEHVGFTLLEKSVMSVVQGFFPFLFFFRCQVKLSVAGYLQEMLYIDNLYLLQN